MRRGGIAATLLALVAMVGGCNLRAVPGTALGFFVPSQQPSAVQALANDLGVEVEGISAYTDGSSWTSIADYQPPQTQLRLYLGLSMSPGNASPAQTPAHLGVFRQVGQSLVDAGQDYAIIRVGWEWSTDFFSWGVQNTTPAQYVTAFDDIVTTMRSVPGQHFLFDWCAAVGAVPTNGSYASSYPGDAYVDYIGTDIYDEPGVGWDSQLSSVGGLAYTAAFARAHGKPMSIPEWGLNGTDDPTFVNDVYGFIADPANNVAYTSYFSDLGQVDSVITSYPQSAARFSADFGG